MTYDVYYKNQLLESGLPVREAAEAVIEDWVADCETDSDGADFANYRIEEVEE